MTPGARRSDRWSRAAAMVSGMSASPTPCIARPATSTGRLAAIAASAPPTATIARQTSVTVRRWRPSPSRPTTGVATAPTSSVAVSDHWALLTLASRSRAIDGMSGAPRLEMIETTVPT